MELKCTKEYCNPLERCLCGESDYRNCEDFKRANNEVPKEVENTDFEYSVNWSGEPFGVIDLNIISQNKRPLIIGLIGPSDAGKTTFLATLYMLLRKGISLYSFSFAGSNTLTGWEKLAHSLTFKSDNEISWLPHTSTDTERFRGLLHVKFKKGKDYKDIIFTDAAGEWFKFWAEDETDERAIHAKWIDNNADAFILFADCKAFTNDKGEAKYLLSSLISRMYNTNNKRPVAFVWAKSDYLLKDDLKNNYNKQIATNFALSTNFNVSVKNTEQHSEILKVINWIVLNESCRINLPEISVKNQDDFFFSIRQNYGQTN
jgi:hypothetical protein